jgi:hypothetical protein
MNSFLQRFLSRKQTSAPAQASAADTPSGQISSPPQTSSIASVSPSASISSPAPVAPAAPEPVVPVASTEPEVVTTPDSGPTSGSMLPVETTTEPATTPAPTLIRSQAPVAPATESAMPAPVKSADSYVDSYSPPTSSPSASSVTAPTPSPEPAQPATPPATIPTAQPEASSSSQSERLEDQNIFVLLGIQNEPEADKEAFLDELQQVIWEDFLSHDVELLLTEEEMKEFRTLSDQPSASEEERQGKLVEFLEKLIPDLERIMLDKALELKEEMVRERLKEMMEQMSGDAAKKSKLEQVQSSFDQEKWFTGAQTLNSLE